MVVSVQVLEPQLNFCRFCMFFSIIALWKKRDNLMVVSVQVLEPAGFL